MQRFEGRSYTVLQGDVRESLAALPERSVHCCVTSPPYWKLRSYLEDSHPDKQFELGQEPLHDCNGWATGHSCGECYVCHMVEVMRSVWRVLRDDGTCWLNLGDSYNACNNNRGPATGANKNHYEIMPGSERGLTCPTLGPKNLLGIPWRVALALQSDGWTLRQEIIWCLSGGAWVYARTQKGDMPMMIRDLARLDPSTVKLWNGERWTQLLGMNRSPRLGDELEIVLRSGERISCTPTHKFPSSRGLLEAAELRIGDCLKSCTIPEPDNPLDPLHIRDDAAWFAGLYLAEGCNVSQGKIQLSGHKRETERWERVQEVARAYGGTCTIKVQGNRQTIRVYGKVICAIVRELVSGHDAADKGIAPVVWRYSNHFLHSFMEGYLGGDGANDSGNRRWRLGFTRNYNLERDLRTACARLGWTLTLKPSFSKCNGVLFPSFRGEIRETRSGHFNEKDRCEIVEIRKSRCREVYDLGVEDEPHLFALASGVLTHNSKKSPMPESVRDRFTKAHEHIFLLAKQPRYYWDQEAIREPAATAGQPIKMADGWDTGPGAHGSYHRNGREKGRSNNAVQAATRNPRSVWWLATEPYPGAHFATFPSEIPRRAILAGTSAWGCCPHCGAGWVRQVEREKLTRPRPNELTKRTGEAGTGNHCANTVAGVATRTAGWRQGCDCPKAEPVPAAVLDPFGGAGTTGVVALNHGRRAILCELHPRYVSDLILPRLGEVEARYGLFT